MGGVCEKGWLQSFNYELHISDLKLEFDSNLIPIGRVKAGIFYHRAFLFKVNNPVCFPILFLFVDYFVFVGHFVFCGICGRFCFLFAF